MTPRKLFILPNEYDHTWTVHESMPNGGGVRVVSPAYATTEEALSALGKLAANPGLARITREASYFDTAWEVIRAASQADGTILFADVARGIYGRIAAPYVHSERAFRDYVTHRLRIGHYSVDDGARQFYQAALRSMTAADIGREL